MVELAQFTAALSADSAADMRDTEADTGDTTAAIAVVLAWASDLVMATDLPTTMGRPITTRIITGLMAIRIRTVITIRQSLLRALVW